MLRSTRPSIQQGQVRQLVRALDGVIVGVEVAHQDHREVAVRRRAARRYQLPSLRLADQWLKASRWVFTKRNQPLPRTVASTAVQPRLTVTGTPAIGTTRLVAKLAESSSAVFTPLVRLARIIVRIVQPSVDLGVGDRRAGPSFGAPFSSAGASKSNSFCSATTL